MSTAYLKQNTITNAVSGNNSVIASFWASRGASGSGIPTNKVVASCDTDFITFDSDTNKFTVVQNCTVNIEIYARGGRSSGGSDRACDFVLYRKNSGGTFSLKTSSGIVNGNVATANNVSLVQNDSIYVMISADPDAGTTMSVYYAIEVI